VGPKEVASERYVLVILLDLSDLIVFPIRNDCGVVMELTPILGRIYGKAHKLVEKDLDSHLEEVVEFYQTKISIGATRAYGTGCSSVAREAFTKLASQNLRTALHTFFFTKKHWQTGRDLNTYLLTCLKRLSEQVYWDQDSSKRINVPICPACKELNRKVFLIPEDKLWRCPSCTSESDRLSNEIRKGKIEQADIAATQLRIRLHNAFALHTRKGYRCADQDCIRFIPDSLRTEYGISCPYSDCSFFGDLEELNDMAHPSAVSRRNNLSLNNKISNAKSEGRETEFGDLIEADVIPPDEQILFLETFQREHKTLLSVIDSQMDTVRRTNSNSTREQKLLMYEAFKVMAIQQPEEMVSYLVHQNQSGDFPIQVRVFQKFISLVEDSLPFSIDKHGETIEIMSLSDPDLGLFSGLSEFDAEVGEDGVIPNNTIETYTGGRKFKNHGSYYLGRLIDVVELESGRSLLEQVISHSFIAINSTVPQGTKVRVSHYRIPPHYEMGAMVFLQRIRRLIVDKVFFRLNGIKRQPMRHHENDTEVEEEDSDTEAA